MGELEPVTRTGQIIHSRDKHLLSCGFDIVLNRDTMIRRVTESRPCLPLSPFTCHLIIKKRARMIQGLLLGRSCLDSYGFTAIMINRTINQASQAPEIYYSSWEITYSVSPISHSKCYTPAVKVQWYGDPDYSTYLFCNAHTQKQSQDAEEHMSIWHSTHDSTQLRTCTHQIQSQKEK